MAEASGTAAGRERLSPAARNAIVGAIIGWAVDFYDIYLPSGALTPALAFFLPETVPAAIRGTVLGIVLIVTLIGRPIGAIIFGHLGDVIGRKRTALIAIAGFGVMTLLMALMPGYATWGLAAVVILTVLRLIGGIFMGGEYTAANPLAMEYCPHRLRGIVGGAIQCAYPMAAIFIFFITALVFTVAPLGGVNSAYVQWGWRIPFFVGSALALGFLVFYWKTVEESRLWQDAAKQEKIENPLKVLFSGQNLRVLAQVFVMMTGFWFITQMTATYMVPFLVTVMKLPAETVNLTFLFANVGLGLGFLTYAALGQRHGRRPWLIVGGLLPMTLGVVLYYLFITNILAGGSLILTLALAAAGFVVVGSAWGMPTTYITERFPTGIRSSAYGVGYSLAVVIPSLFNFYLLGLAKIMPYDYTLLVLVFVGGLLLTIGALIGPETRDVEFTARAFEVRERPTDDQPSVRPAVE